MNESHLINEEDWYKDIGYRVKAARNEQGLTQEGLAKLAGLQRTSITNIEKGKPISELLPDIVENTKVTIGGKENVLSPKSKAVLDELMS